MKEATEADQRKESTKKWRTAMVGAIALHDREQVRQGTLKLRAHAHSAGGLWQSLWREIVTIKPPNDYRNMICRSWHR